MYPVSPRFLDAISGSHRAVVRVQVLPTSDGEFPQFGAAPVGGTELPLLSGDVKLTSTAAVNGTVDLTISGDYWDLLQPYGAELFVERGVDFGDGTREYVPCGYYGIEEISQDKAPSGPAQVQGADRSRRLQRNRVVYPIEFPPGTTHKAIFDRLVNGITPAGEALKNYPMFVGGIVPITFTGYDPNFAKLGTSLTCEDDAHAFLSKLADVKGCVLRFNRVGELVVQLRNIPPGAPAVYTVSPGPTGNLVGASRKVTRDGIYNYVVARGSDPANPTGYRLAHNDDPGSPLRWYGPFGAVIRYYASPLLLTNDSADAAAETVLARYKGLPSSLSLMAVPNPALEALDVVEAVIGTTRATHLTDQVTIPLVGSQPVQIVTRTLHEVPTSDDDLGGGTGTFPNPADPGGVGTGGTPVGVPWPTNFTTTVTNRQATSTWTVPAGVDATELHEFLVDPVNTLKASLPVPGNTRTSAVLTGGREYLYAARCVQGGVVGPFSDRVRVHADFTTTNEGGAGTLQPGVGGTPGGTIPTTLAGILRVGAAAGLTKVNLGVDFLAGQGPAGKQGTHVDYPLNVLTAATLPSELAGYCDIRADVGAVRLTSYVGAATTPNSTHSRTETRELASDGVAKESFDDTSGDHYVWVDGAIVRLAPGRPHCVIAQLHDASNDIATIRVEGTNVVSTFGNTGRPGTLATGLVPGSRHQWQIKTVRSGSSTVIQYFWDDMTAPKATQSYAGGAGNYFKYGNYHQSTTSDDAQGATFVVDLFDSEIWHTGYPEPAPRNSAGGIGGGTPGGTPGGTTTRTAGPGGVSTPAGALLGKGSAGSQLNIDGSTNFPGGTSANPKVYDGQGRTVGRINITADWVVVQNYKIDAGNQYGVFIEAENVVFQNNDIKGLTPTGDGDLNAMTVFGSGHKILYNTAIDYVVGDPGASHTDAIQTWISSSHFRASNDWQIVGNVFTGPANPSRNNSVASIHQCLMVEGQGHGGNSGGSGGQQSNWYIADNTFGASWGQDCKFDCTGKGIVFTRNKFVGSSDRVIEDDTGGGIKFYSDNQIGSGYGQVGMSITAGSGPPSTV